MDETTFSTPVSRKKGSGRERGRRSIEILEYITSSRPSREWNLPSLSKAGLLLHLFYIDLSFHLQYITYPFLLHLNRQTAYSLFLATITNTCTGCPIPLLHQLNPQSSSQSLTLSVSTHTPTPLHIHIPTPKPKQICVSQSYSFQLW
jgi:hypothetical protein